MPYYTSDTQDQECTGFSEEGLRLDLVANRFEDPSDKVWPWKPLVQATETENANKVHLCTMSCGFELWVLCQFSLP